jgi:hypothetical protein
MDGGRDGRALLLVAEVRCEVVCGQRVVTAGVASREVVSKAPTMQPWKPRQLPLVGGNDGASVEDRQEGSDGERGVM